MDKIKLISFEDAQNMSVAKIETQLGICRRILVNDSGFSEVDANNLMTNIVRLVMAIERKKKS